MFTGIIEEVGTIRRVQKGRSSAVLEIKAEKVLEDLRIGDSIAVNGVCLTVVSFDRKGFSADVMHETLNRSSLAGLSGGSRINLERAMGADGRFGGHIVAGHVDGTGTIAEIRKDDRAVWYRIRAGDRILRYIVEKGSIAVDGISLTVAAVSEKDFSVSVIPHTASETTLGEKRTGDTVNLETDLIGKYVERFLSRPPESGRAAADEWKHRDRLEEKGKQTDGAGPSQKSGITREFLSQYGF